MKGKLELYQQEIDAASKPVLTRLEYYRGVMYQIKILLDAYFFDVTRTQKLTEAAEGDKVVFSFNTVHQLMKNCLVDEEILIKTAQDIQGVSRYPSFVAALDANVLNSGLPIELHDNCLYTFNPEKPYTSTAQDFMQQFAYALSTYRVCLGICGVYFKIFRHDFVQMEQSKNYVGTAHNLEQKLDGEVNLISLYKEAKAIRKEINGLLGAKKIHEGIEDFKIDADGFAAELIELLNSGALHLENRYKEFPNNAIFWMVHDRSWHTLLKNISGLLYVNNYTSSTLSGTLEIKKEFIDVVRIEIEQFESVMASTMPLLKKSINAH